MIGKFPEFGEYSNGNIPRYLGNIPLGKGIFQPPLDGYKKADFTMNTINQSNTNTNLVLFKCYSAALPLRIVGTGTLNSIGLELQNRKRPVTQLVIGSVG